MLTEHSFGLVAWACGRLTLPAKIFLSALPRRALVAGSILCRAELRFQRIELYNFAVIDLLSSLALKQVLGVTGAVIDPLSFIPYVRSILSGHTKPHLFSWIIWTTVMAVGFAGQVAGGGGIGSAVLGISTVSTGAVTLLAAFKGERKGTFGDWVCLLTCAGAIPLWVVTEDPLPSVIVVTCVDMVAYIPTLRKSWWRPEEELILTWGVGIIKFALAFAALETYSLVTCLYPSAIITANIVLVCLLAYRRKVLDGENSRESMTR